MNLKPDRGRMSQLVAAEMRYFGSRYALSLVAGSAALVALATVLFSVFYYIGQAGNSIDLHFMVAGCIALGLIVAGSLIYRVFSARRGPRFGSMMFFSAFCCLMCAVCGFIFVRTILRWQMPDLAQGAYDRFIRTILSWSCAFPLLVLAACVALLFLFPERRLPYFGWTYLLYILIPLSIFPFVIFSSRFCTVDNLLSVSTLLVTIYLSLNLALAVHFFYKLVLNSLLTKMPGKYETFIKARHSVPKPGEVKVTAADLVAVQRALQEGEALPELRPAGQPDQEVEREEAAGDSAVSDVRTTPERAADATVQNPSGQREPGSKREETVGESAVSDVRTTPEPVADADAQNPSEQREPGSKREETVGDSAVSDVRTTPEPVADADAQNSSGQREPGLVRFGAKGIRALYRYLLPRGYRLKIHPEDPQQRENSVAQIIARVHPPKPDALTVPPELEQEYQDIQPPEEFKAPAKKRRQKGKQKKYYKAPAVPGSDAPSLAEETERPLGQAAPEAERGADTQAQPSDENPESCKRPDPEQPAPLRGEGEKAVADAGSGAGEESSAEPDAVSHADLERSAGPVPGTDSGQPASEPETDSCCDMPDDGSSRPHNGREWFADIQRQLEALSSSSSIPHPSTDGQTIAAQDIAQSLDQAVESKSSSVGADADAEHTGEDALEPGADTDSEDTGEDVPEPDAESDSEDTGEDAPEPGADADAEHAGEDAPEPDAESGHEDDRKPVQPQHVQTTRVAKRRSAPPVNDEPDIVELLEDEEQLCPEPAPAADQEELEEILEDVVLEPPASQPEQDEQEKTEKD